MGKIAQSIKRNMFDTIKVPFDIWEGRDMPGNLPKPELMYFGSALPAGKGTVIIFPGGGYTWHAAHEGEGIARMLNTFGMDVFVLYYRTAPASKFPDQLYDARRAVRYVRFYAEEFGIDKNKIAVMGASAGGHLAALVSTYREKLENETVDEIDKQDYMPNIQILCYPYIYISTDASGDNATLRNLIGLEHKDEWHKVMPHLLADEKTPPAFIFHTAEDPIVDVRNSYAYASRLREVNVPCELHVFPHGVHGLGVATIEPHASQWCGLLKNYLQLKEFIPQ